MAIQILPARLANQIAAGEVVERPASVVKELVENSIDAGATRIDIDIEKGGSKLIRIRDNGSGIAKEELELALSRHATSKITCLDDLEAIISLGFRGEALASISSVSRLTLTSRTVTQSEAWSAYAEGRDMAVKVKPAAHPVGTTVEVVDLFFNTPARRKFLRTDKTEFGHIDELLKRIALSRFDVAITLRHNGAIVRQYRAATNDVQREKRLAAVCGPQFVKTAVEVSLEHQGLTLQGWICTPEGARAQNDIQHCFVNKRMMKDKLINHAIRQGYEASLRPDQFAAYVLYIDIDPHQVDVNVHPAKHEVRFHQARLVHDFIYQAVADALMQVTAEPEPISALNFADNETAGHPTQQAVEGDEGVKDTAYSNYPGQAEYSEWRPQASGQPARASGFSQSSAGRSSGGSSGQRCDFLSGSAPSRREQNVYQSLMTTPVVPDPVREIAEASAVFTPSTPQAPVSTGHAAQGLGKALTVVNAKYLLLQREEGIALLDLDAAAYLSVLGTFRQAGLEEGLKAQPLLIPQALPASAEELELVALHEPLLQQFGILLRKKSASQVMVMAVCQPFRHHNLQQFIPALMAFLTRSGKKLDVSSLSTWLTGQAVQKTDVYSLSQSVTLLTELENCWQGALAEHYSVLLRPVDVVAAIEAFNHD